MSSSSCASPFSAGLHPISPPSTTASPSTTRSRAPAPPPWPRAAPGAVRAPAWCALALCAAGEVELGRGVRGGAAKRRCVCAVRAQVAREWHGGGGRALSAVSWTLPEWGPISSRASSLTALASVAQASRVGSAIMVTEGEEERRARGKGKDQSLGGGNIGGVSSIVTEGTGMGATTGTGTTVVRKDGCISNPTTANGNHKTEGEVAMGYTMTEICDQFIEFFMYKKPQTKDWRKVLVFREEWRRYREHFYKRCEERRDAETDSAAKQKFVVLARKVKKIDDEIEKHMELYTELRDNPADINAIVARRRMDFTGEFFRHLNFLLNAYNGLDERDGIVRLGAKCLSAIHAYDCTMEQLDIESAQSKFDDILNSSSLDDACDKIKSLAKAKELDSSLILLINRAWAAAKDSAAMKDEVKDIMYHIYTTAKESIKSISPPEMKLLKYLLNIEDPEERFGALATAFAPGDEHEAKDEDTIYTTPNELHRWIKMMLDSYHLNKEETEFIDARKMSDPVIIQRLTLLKETIEEEYMKQYIHPEEQESMDDEESEE
ncbi:hypothetical protein ACP70R_001921 [Stipagrostis hirtigluma subsp. patula]